MIEFFFYELKSWRVKREKEIDDGDLGDRQECGVRGWTLPALCHFQTKETREGGTYMVFFFSFVQKQEIASKGIQEMKEALASHKEQGSRLTHAQAPTTVVADSMLSGSWRNTISLPIISLFIWATIYNHKRYLGVHFPCTKHNTGEMTSKANRQTTGKLAGGAS